MRTPIAADKVVEHVNRMAQDDELREHAKSALESAMAVYQKIQADGPRKAAVDKGVTEDVISAAQELREAARRASNPTPPSRGPSLFKILLLVIVAAAAILGARRILGEDEDEFEYRP
jgi:hypothetical protein